MTEGSTNHARPPANFKLSLKCFIQNNKTRIIILRVNTKTGYVSEETVRDCSCKSIDI